MESKTHKASEVSPVDNMQDIINAIPGGVVIYKLKDGFHHIEYASAGMAEISGVSVEELKQMSIEERKRRFSDDFERSAKEIARAVKDGDTADLVIRIKHDDGKHIHVQVQGRKIGEDNGCPLVQCSFHDVTKRVEAEEKLYQSEQGLTIAFSSANIYHWELDLATLTFSGSGVIRKLFGTDINDDKLETWLNCGALAEPYRSRARSMFTDVINGKISASTEIRVPLRDGSSAWIRLRASLVYDEEGKPVKAICTGEDIDAYKDLQERFEKVLQQNGIRTWEYDFKDGSIKYTTDSKGVGVRETEKIENIPENLIDAGLVRGESVAILREMYARLNRGMPNVACTTKWLIRGQERWIRTDYTVVYGIDSKPQRAIGSGRDVTELMDSRLRFEEAYLFQESAAKNALMSCVIDVPSGKVLSYRGSKGVFTPIVASDAGDLAERAMMIMTDSTERIDFRRRFSLNSFQKSYQKGQTEITATYRFLSIDAKPLWVELHGAISRDPDSGALICFIYGADRTEAMTARAIIEAVTSFDFDFIANLNIFSGDMRVFVRRDEQGGFAARGRDMLYSDFVNIALANYILPDDRKAASEAFNVANVYKRLKNAPMFEHIYRIKDAKGVVRVKKTRFADYDLKNGMVLFSRTDVTELMEEQEEQRRVLTASLKLAENANRSKTDFLLRMSHDMRTPMNAILGFSELGMDSGDINESRSYHDKVNSSGKYLLALINDVLDMSKIESGSMKLVNEPFRTREVIERLSDLLVPRAKEKRISLKIEVDDSVPEYIVGDRLRIEQIFMNILGNSIKYTPAGGHASFWLESKNTVAAAELHCVIKDDGIGMSKEFQRRMFLPFEQEDGSASNADGGTGLGLSIVKKLIDLKRGTIMCSSERGKGTMFDINFIVPISSGADVRREERKLTGASELAGKCALICEDHPLNAQITIKLLSRRGMLVELAENGKIGLEMFAQSLNYHYDAILMDMQMPVMDGIEATKLIRALDRPDAKTVPIIALTANAYDEDKRRTKEAGMSAFVAKPVNAAKLYQTLEDLIK